MSAVPPEATLFRGKNGTVVCRAAAGRPAAQISWTPAGDCDTEEEPLGNDTVTVQSTCLWEDHPVSTVSCSVSHLTGNQSLSIDLNSGDQSSLNLNIVYISFFTLIILIIVGSICLLKLGVCRMKCNPMPVTHRRTIYDTVNRVKRSEVLQSEVDGLCLHTS
ncbi:cell surface glycoprotein CD200 receptor 1-like [Hyaena hyaena]|uniref:cell surface glycoprotein CD200 receptor 1-like n=1 Tax=Hyaena hyaena TaxID=95912 RepID=UPI001922F6D4|nr:cell surface glycoprotein CD200 receptor 1-like [Hyaena hyaena]